MSDKKVVPKYVPFVVGGSAGMMATCFVHPMDVVKNRMQVSGIGSKVKEYKTSFHAAGGILRNEGVTALYSGLSAGLLRQATYTTARLGVFNGLTERVSKDGAPPSFGVKVLIGLCAGAVGAFVGTPADLTLIRMTTDGRLPPAERRNYSNALTALARIAKEEGILALWKGAVPTMGRAMVVNAVQLSTYQQAKQQLLTSGYFEENIKLHFCASMISGLATTIASMPLDIAKTRIQNMKVVEGKPQFTGTIDVLSKVVRHEGVFALWKGFTPYYARLGPHTVLTFIFMEQLNQLYKSLA
ncbi:hypothetical protein FOCC_FOCC003537 [Frankliniella occidentalis]|uniref:Mitochondrial 2-oxoglutarate/malate carrier protein n=1 Tax=Frankliniella occidentalis TaxID=133901 RepID=A0A6J1SD51_FRAOC|nr:mitochondrial 2-oxoglutarate/malate carrier protein [Frankliniella occidentalis]XP_052120916.1 mitochondrial 2-oxoglutarate/malate carrier protein-like [Frankliniella occidentalis]KAE8749796.1 hypothetical protein FOCC_FOCC003534 [Frankliniella occidentalis]KAE8749799.1 hypothetical protein FOCC_FOCC003537 [Frankliniella occidentalis]